MFWPLRAVSARKLHACRSDPDTMPKVRRSEREKGRVRGVQGVHGAVGRKSRRGLRFATTHAVTAPDLSRSCVTYIATFRKPPRPAATLNNPTRTHGSNPARHTLPEKPVVILAEIFALPPAQLTKAETSSFAIPRFWFVLPFVCRTATTSSVPLRYHLAWLAFHLGSVTRTAVWLPSAI